MASPATPGKSGGHGPPRNPIARRWWLNAALVLIVAALAAFAWYRTAYPPQESKPTLTALDPGTIRRVEIERAKQPAVVLEHGEGGWRLAAPLKARADGFAVDSLLRLAHAPVEATVTPTDTELGRYGLAPPALTVRFDGNEILFGDPHPLRGDYYVRHGGAIRLISNRYYAQAATNFTNFIDARLFEPGRKPISFKLPGFAVTMKDGGWQRQPEIPALSSDRINAFVDEWRHARALQVQKYSGRHPAQQVEVTLEDENNRPVTLRIGVVARKPELVLVRFDEGLEYHFPEETGRRLFDLNADEPK